MDRFDSLRRQINATQTRTFSCQFEGRKVWVKRAEFVQPRWSWVGKLLSRFNKNPLFIPTQAAAGPEAIVDEAKRLRYLSALDVPVPELIAAEDDWLALADAGPSLKSWLLAAATSDSEKKQLLLAAAEALAALHQSGRWHGRPALRDMAWDGKQIRFLDFEEDPGRVMTPAQCQVRDLLVFVHGLYRYLPANSPIIADTIARYKQLAPMAVWQQSVQLVDNMWLLYRLTQLLAPVAGKDVRQAYYALRILRSEQAKRRSRIRWLIITSLSLSFTLANHIDS